MLCSLLFTHCLTLTANLLLFLNDCNSLCAETLIFYSYMSHVYKSAILWILLQALQCNLEFAC